MILFNRNKTLKKAFEIKILEHKKLRHCVHWKCDSNQECFDIICSLEKFYWWSFIEGKLSDVGVKEIQTQTYIDVLPKTLMVYQCQIILLILKVSFTGKLRIVFNWNWLFHFLPFYSSLIFLGVEVTLFFWKKWK